MTVECDECGMAKAKRQIRREAKELYEGASIYPKASTVILAFYSSAFLKDSLTSVLEESNATTSFSPRSPRFESI
jgi:hypothetical protein